MTRHSDISPAFSPAEGGQVRLFPGGRPREGNAGGNIRQRYATMPRGTRSRRTAVPIPKGAQRVPTLPPRGGGRDERITAPYVQSPASGVPLARPGAGGPPISKAENIYRLSSCGKLRKPPTFHLPFSQAQDQSAFTLTNHPEDTLFNVAAGSSSIQKSVPGINSPAFSVRFQSAESPWTITADMSAFGILHSDCQRSFPANPRHFCPVESRWNITMNPERYLLFLHIPIHLMFLQKP